MHILLEAQLFIYGWDPPYSKCGLLSCSMLASHGKWLEMPLLRPSQGCSEMPTFKEDALSDFYVHFHIKELRTFSLVLGLEIV